MLDKLFALGKALRHGEELANSATWKNRQLAINAIGGLLGAVLVFYPTGMSDADIQTLAGAVAILGGLFNAWATASTSRKVGLPPRRGDTDDPHADPGGAMG